jgi:hypothetical protein
MNTYLCKKNILVNAAGPGNFPEKFPVFWIATPELIGAIQRKFLKATEFGMDADYRKICATRKCKEGLSFREVLDGTSELQEISETEYKILITIPHWNPVEELNRLLDQFLAQENLRDKEQQETILNHIFEKMQEAKLEGNFNYE